MEMKTKRVRWLPLGLTLLALAPLVLAIDDGWHHVMDMGFGMAIGASLAWFWLRGRSPR